jgi:hypothetical protein
MEKLYLQLVETLSMTNWTGHVGNAGMIDFYSRPGLFLIPDDMITEEDFDIINLLTQGIYCVNVRRALRALLWYGVHRYIPIKDVLRDVTNVSIVACFSGRPRDDYRSNVDYTNHTSTQLYWADINYHKLKLIMGEYLRKRINDLLEVGQAAIPHSPFVYVPRPHEDEDEFMADDIIQLLKKKCREELALRERFNRP